MSMMQRIVRIEQELGITPDEPVAPISIVQTFAVRTVARHVCREMNIPFDQLMSPQRSDALFQARSAISWIARNRLRRALPQIAMILGVDHSSVRHQIIHADQRIAVDPAFRQTVDLISRRLFSRQVIA